MKDTVFSVVTVCRNAAEDLRKTARSLLAQSCTDVEYVVVDGASADATPQVLREIAAECDHRGIAFRSVSEPDKGIYDAMNKGTQMATGQWVCFMNAGDVFHSPDTLAELAPFAARPAHVLYGSVCQVMQFGKVTLAPRQLPTLRRKMAFCHQSALVRRALLLEHPFDLRFPLCADYELFFWCYTQGKRFEQVPFAVADFEAEEGVSSQNRLRMNREFARINGRDKTLKWKLEYAGKALEVGFNAAWRSILPQSATDALRQRNYRKLQQRLGRPALIMTLLVKNEAAIIAENLRFHRAMGVDGVIVTDNNSSDETRQILQRYKEKGWVLEIIDEPAEGYEQQRWVDRMIRLAKDKYHATWVVNADADEFWHAPSGSLRDTLLRAKGNVARCPMRTVYPDETRPWTEWTECINPVPQTMMDECEMGPYNMFGQSPCKVAHRTRGYLRISMGNHKVRMWWPRKAKTDIVIYHYVYRGRQHFREKVINGGQQLEKHKSKHGGRHWRYFYQLYKQGRLDAAYDAVAAVRHIPALRQAGYLVPQCPVPQILKKSEP